MSVGRPYIQRSETVVKDVITLTCGLSAYYKRFSTVGGNSEGRSRKSE